MRILPLLVVLAASLAVPVSVDAAQDPTPPRDDPERNVPMRPELDSFLSVFDSEGLPMLHVSAPTYLYLGERRKLRHQDLGPGNNENNNNNNNDDNNGDSETPPIMPPSPRPVPEPAAMLMLVPAAILAIRKSRRGNSLRS